MSQLPEYTLPKDAYVNFDALSLKSYMISQLNKEGKFTDQNYEGSNISSIINILSYFTHVLLFYANQNTADGTFDQTSIYESMNRIVKLIDYKPTGKQTSMVSVDCVASAALSQGSYKIRKYSYFLIDNIQYVFNGDVNFEKSTNAVENIVSISDNAILYQGTVGEYPIYTSEGVEYETIPIVVDNLVDNRDDRFISHGSISVYVKETESDSWKEYTEVDSLYLQDSTSRVYDIRLNENGHYQVKFGNGIFGRKLSEGDQVAIFYILSDNEKGMIAKNSINGNKLFTYNSPRFNEIYNQVSIGDTSLVINDANRSNLTFTNPSNSTLISSHETVDQIRENAPAFLASQTSLVRISDYENYLRKNLPSVVNSVKVVDNKTFINGYIDYFYRMCIDPNKVNRVILNQVNFADSCDFNNVNVFIVPNFEIGEDGAYPEFASNSFKNLIIEMTNDKKTVGAEVVPRDPIYMAIDFGFTNSTVSSGIISDTKLIVVRERNDKTSKESIKGKVLNVIKDYFTPSNIELGQTIDMSSLNSSILSIDGVRNIRTTNSKENISFNGISFVCWNPVFPGSDESLINQTTTLSYFKFPYLYNPKTLSTRIEVIDE